MRDLRALFQKTGGLRQFGMLLALRCPFEGLRSVAMACFLQFAFDAILRADPSALRTVCVAYGIASVLLFLYNGTVWTVYTSFSIRWTGRVRTLLLDHIARLPLQRIESEPSGAWLTRLNADVRAATALLNQPLQLAHAAVAIVNISVSVVIFACISPPLLLLTLAFVIPHLLLSRRFVSGPATALSKAAQEATAGNTTRMHALVTCHETALLYDAQPWMLAQFEQSSLALRRANLHLRLRGALESALLPMLGMLGYLALLIAGGAAIAAGHLTFGTLTAAFQYRGGLLIGAMMLTNSIFGIRTSLAGVARISDTLQMPQEE